MHFNIHFIAIPAVLILGAVAYHFISKYLPKAKEVVHAEVKAVEAEAKHVESEVKAEVKAEVAKVAEKI